MEYYSYFDVTNYIGGKGILLSSSNQFEKLIIQRTIMESFIVISFVVSEKKRGRGGVAHRDTGKLSRWPLKIMQIWAP